MNVTEVKPHQAYTKVLVLQDYLSIGYIFLLVVGVFNETIYYKFLGINILEYSSILDVLISPIAVMLGNLILAFAVLAVILFMYIYVKTGPRYYNWLATKKKYQEGKNKLKLEKSKALLESKNGLLILIAIAIFSMFIGLGIGRGQKTQQKIQKGDIKMTHSITFNNGDQQKVKILDKNSLYVFYVTPENREITIAPIESNIHLIQNLKEEAN